MAKDDFDFEEDEDTGEKYVRLSEKDAIAQRELARQATANVNAADERDAAQRELAFLKAGVDAGSPIGKMFVKAYDGDLTAEAIKAAATEIPGLVGEPAAPAPSTPTPEEAEAARLAAEQTGARQELNLGNSNAGTPPAPDPRDTARETVIAAKQRGMSNDKAMVEGFEVLVAGAIANDQRVLIPMPGSDR